jgi:CRISPR-associated Cas5-like protein
MTQNNPKVIVFELFAEHALWQLPSEAMARWSAPLPAPSALAGILGASMGFRQSGKAMKTGGWEVSQE